MALSPSDLSCFLIISWQTVSPNGCRLARSIFEARLVYVAVIASTPIAVQHIQEMCPSYWTVRFYPTVEALCHRADDYAPHIVVLDLSHRDTMYRAAQLNEIRSAFPSASTIGYTCVDSIPKTFVWTECKAILDDIVLQSDTDGMERAVARAAGRGVGEQLAEVVRREIGMVRDIPARRDEGSGVLSGR
jgi:hypothetical protein